MSWLRGPEGRVSILVVGNAVVDLSITHKPQLEVRAQFDVGQA
jgi:hypothetical protein